MTINNYWQLDQGILLKSILIFVSFFVAILSWRYIETPFRLKKILPTRASMIGATIATAVMALAIGLIGYKTKGFPTRIPANVQAYCDTKVNPIDNKDVDDIASDHIEKMGDQNATPSVLIWGDSHARVMSVPLELALKDSHKSAYMISYSATLPVHGEGKSPMELKGSEKEK